MTQKSTGDIPSEAGSGLTVGVGVAVATVRRWRSPSWCRAPSPPSPTAIVTLPAFDGVKLIVACPSLTGAVALD